MEYEQRTFGVCRPCKEFNNKEIQIYMKIHDLSKYLLSRENYLAEYDEKNKKMPSLGSINFLLEDFVDGLQEEFQSTMYNVLNTIEKV